VSIAQLGGRSDRLEAIVELTRAMNGALRLDDEQLRREFRRRNVLSGTRTTLRCGARTVTGTVLECDPHRGLRVDVEGEVICLPAETTTVLAAADGANDISCRDQEVPAKGRDALKRD
jgi:hypothetical protein